MNSSTQESSARTLSRPLARRTGAAFALVLLATACDQEPSPTAPPAVDPSFLISDGAHGGNEHFYFLSPVVPSPSPAGTFDASLEPVVEVCALNPSGECGAPIAIFNSLTGPGSETVRVSTTDELYVANWHTGDFALDEGVTYRVSVHVGNQQLGFADVDVVSSGRELKNVATGEYIGLVDGRTLPVKFRIEEGALSAQGQLSAGGYHSCVVDAGGAAYCAGNNTSGQLGDGSFTQTPPYGSATPVGVVGGHTFRSIATGSFHTCGVTTDGDAYCWGNNNEGQLGNGAVNQASPYGIAAPVLVAGSHTWLSIAPGYAHTCGLTTEGDVYCWGHNGYGQLGRGNWSYIEPSPAPIAGTETFQSVRSLGYHTCAVSTTGEGRCWGYNYYGGVGDGTAYPNYVVPSPTAVSGGHVFASIDAGMAHSCGVTTDGDALCWGHNRSGEVGDGTVTTRVTTPAGVSGGQVFRSVRAGEGHTCGITSTGAALCWGSNGNGQLGSGTATKVVATPLAVAGGHTFTELDTGRYHTCGVTTLGEVRCWGYNGTGQLGNGTFSTSQTPTLSLFDLTPES